MLIIHIDHRRVQCSVSRDKRGYYIRAIADAGASDRGFKGGKIRSTWSAGGSYGPMTPAAINARIERPAGA